MSAGVVPKLVEFMSAAYDTEPKTQLEAAWALTNIVSGTSDQTRVVVEAGVCVCVCVCVCVHLWV